ncbi:hypothetical protein [uncultured Vagococcus sp.]|uniref:hypothetical protein n=1 Tax=uncultured Vagococcus sp. TaxID=189676 RepID=UPI002584CA3B|nr:hypothetical protein [uncultured Vagococcus sp.]
MASILKRDNKYTLPTLSKEILTSILEDFPYKRMEDSFLVTKEDKYQAYLRIATQNVFSLSEKEQTKLMDSLTTLLRVFVDCINIVSLKFPPALEKNVQFWQRQLISARSNGNMPQVISCQENLNKIFWVEKNLPELEFFITIFGESKEDLESNIKLINRFSSELQLTELEPDEVEKIVFKLCNMNTDI